VKDIVHFEILNQKLDPRIFLIFVGYHFFCRFNYSCIFWIIHEFPL